MSDSEELEHLVRAQTTTIQALARTQPEHTYKIGQLDLKVGQLDLKVDQLDLKVDRLDQKIDRVNDDVRLIISMLGRPGAGNSPAPAPAPAPA
jgi:peptidoglycan hydrolase CwlO-like protein